MKWSHFYTSIDEIFETILKYTQKTDVQLSFDTFLARNKCLWYLYIFAQGAKMLDYL